MVTKTITIPDGVYDTLRDMMESQSITFSRAISIQLKRGQAYAELLAIQEEERNSLKTGANIGKVI